MEARERRSPSLISSSRFPMIGILKRVLTSTRTGKTAERVWGLAISLLTVYVLSVYIFPLYGIIPYFIYPLKVPLEITLCFVSVFTGIATGVWRMSLGEPCVEIQDSFLILDFGNRMIGTCCLEISSVPGSVYPDEDGKPRYRDGLLLAMRAGLHKSATVALEAGVANAIPFLRLFITVVSRTPKELKDILRTEATRVEAILLASLNAVELQVLAGEDLKNAVSLKVDPLGYSEPRLPDASDYVSLVTLKGLPRVFPTDESSQIGTFVSTLLKQDYSASLTCVFSAAPPGRERKKLESAWRTIQARERRKEESLEDYARKKKLVKKYAEIGDEAGWFDSSVYFIVKGESQKRLKTTEEGVRAIVLSIWGGEDSVQLKSRKLSGGVLYSLLCRRHFIKQRLHSSQLAAFVNTPVQRLPSIGLSRIPHLQIPPRHMVSGEVVIGRAVLDGRLLFPVGLRREWLREHVAILGATGTGKTTVVKHIMKQITETTSIPWWIFDIKGSEYSEMAGLGDIEVIRPGIEKTFTIDLVDSKLGSDGGSVYSTFSMVRELLRERGESSDLSPAMERLLRESIVRMASSHKSDNAIQLLVDTINEISSKDRIGNLTRDALLNRLEVLTREPLGSILRGGPQAADMTDLLQKRVIFDLQYVSRIGGMDAARLLYNLIAKRIFDYSMKRGIVPGLHHIVVLEEASNLVPESYTRSTAADVTTGESMVMLQRATGQGVIVVSTRPNISTNILANTATKVVFRLPYDSKVGERFLSLDEEQGRYLTSLKRGRALVSIPQTETFEMATAPFVAPPHQTLESLPDQASLLHASTPDSTGVHEIPTGDERPSGGTGAVIFDRIGQYGNHLVAHLASKETATELEIRELIRSMDSSITREDTDEILRDLVSFGTIERESFSLVPGGVVYTLPGRSSRAIRNLIIEQILAALQEDEEVTVSEMGGNMPDLILSDKAIMIQPDHLKSSSLKPTVKAIRRCMKTLGTGMSELFVVVRGSVAAARLRDLLGNSNEFEAVTVVSAFPSSIESMMDSIAARGKRPARSEPPEHILPTEETEEAAKRAVLDAMHDVGTATSRAVQIRLWFEMIQEFVALSGGQVAWDSVLQFIDTTAVQSLKGRTAPLMKEEGKRALTELLADEVLTAIRVGSDVGISGLESGLWIVNSSVLKDMKASVVASFESEYAKRGLSIKKDHGYYDFCAGSASYVVFPTQQQLSTLMNVHNDVACRKCQSSRVVCILTAAEYLEDSTVTPGNLDVLTMEDNVSSLVV
jgi:hypothetical protein